MKLAYPAFADVIHFDGRGVPCLVIENKELFRSLVCNITDAIEGDQTDLVLSRKEKILDFPKHVELLTDFIHFDLNKKSLLNKVIAELEKTAVSPEHYIKTQELLAEIDRLIGDWAFAFSCDIVPTKTSVSALLKAVGIEIRDEYQGHRGEAEKILDYMELVREFDRDKLFVTVNMRSFFNDAIIYQFQKTALSHEFKILMLESQSYSRLPLEKRVTIDADLCEF